MKRKAAIIAAAGWHGSGCLTDPAPPHTQDFLKPLAGCPEALLPLGDGETPLSRLAQQLKGLDYEVYIGVGKSGCLWHLAIQRRIKRLGKKSLTEVALEFGRSKSPWNKDKIEYCKRFGAVVEIPTPDGSGRHVTFLKVLESIEQPFELIMLVCGDCLFTNALIKEIDSRGPHIFFTQYDEVHILNEAGIEIWKDEILNRERMRSNRPHLWHKLGQEVEERLRVIGIPYLHMENMYPRKRWGEQMDLDFPDWIRFSTYVQALEWIKKYGNDNYEINAG